MLKKIALLSTLSVLALTHAFAANNVSEKAGELKDKAVEQAKHVKDKAVELKDKAADKMSALAGQKAAAVDVTNIWARPSATTTSAVYLTIQNVDSKDLTLTSVTAEDIANKVAIHQSTPDNAGVVKMVTLDKVVIPAGKAVEMQPNGIHIMLIDLKKALVLNDKFHITLKFSDGSTKTVEVETKDLPM